MEIIILEIILKKKSIFNQKRIAAEFCRLSSRLFLKIQVCSRSKKGLTSPWSTCLPVFRILIHLLGYEMLFRNCNKKAGVKTAESNCFPVVSWVVVPAVIVLKETNYIPTNLIYICLNHLHKYV